MKSGNKEALDAYRLLYSAIVTAEKSNPKFGDDEIVKLFLTERKKRLDSIEVYLEHGATEAADKESFEIKILNQFLPEEASEERIQELVDIIIETTLGGSFEKKDTGSVMKLISEMAEEANVIVDKKLVSKYLSTKLN